MSDTNSSEVLESGSGAMLPPSRTDGTTVGRSRKGLLVGGGVVAAFALAGGAVWAAMSFLSTGAQPAEALPSTTLAYASIDLDPSGGQKIEAVRTLRKFPAFKDKIGLSTTDDIRAKIFGEVQDAGACPEISFKNDVDPWLGDRAAVAAVDLGDKHPDAVVAIQVKDDKAANTGLKKLVACAEKESSGDGGGFVVSGDWAVIAQTQDIAQQVTDAAAKSSLADDATFKKWTSAAGDSGIVTLYAAPAAGDYIADHADDLFGFGTLLGLGGGGEFSCSSTSDSSGPCSESGSGSASSSVPVPSAYTPLSSTKSDDGSLLPKGVTDALRDFKGAAIVFRFHDGAFELEGASDAKGGLGGGGDIASDRGSEVIETLPSDTAAAFGAGFEKGWFSTYLANAAKLTGGAASSDELTQEITDETGLTPSEIESLLGSSAAVAVGGDVDPDQVFSDSTDPADVPIALKVKGDPDQIKAVLAKLSAKFGDDTAQYVGSDADGDTIAIGPDEAFRKQVLENGKLGGDGTYRDVIEHRNGASAVFYVNVNRFDKAIEKAAGDDQDVVDNTLPLSGVGMSAWQDGDTAHFLLRVTTD